MVTQTQLRAKSLTSADGTDRTQKARQLSAQRKQQTIQREQQKAVEQKTTLQSEISKISSRLNEIEGIRKKEKDLSKSLQSERAKLRAEASALNTAYEQIKSGGYYQDLSSIINQARQSGIQAQNQTNLSLQPSKKVIPTGAKVVKTEFINGQRIITYVLPAQEQAGITEPAKTTTPKTTKDFVGPIKPADITTDKKEVTVGSIVQQIGKEVSAFGAGIGNILEGRSYYTPTYYAGEESLYPGQAGGKPPITNTNIPIGSTPILVEGSKKGTTQVIYVSPSGTTYSDKGNIIQTKDIAESVALSSRAQKIQETTYSLSNLFSTSQTNLVSAQSKLNTQIERFNQRYSNRELTSEELKQYEKDAKAIEEAQEDINKRFATTIKEIKTEEQKTKYIEETPYLTLLTSNPKYIPIKASRELGEAYFSAIGSVGSSIFFKGEKQLSEEQIKSGGRMLGEFALFSAFSPFFKTGTYSQQELTQPISKYEEYVYDKVGNIIGIKNKLTGKMTRLQATSEFAKASEERQINILKKAFTQDIDDAGNIVKKIYLDRTSLLKDIEKAKNFMRESGLSEIQINQRINKLFPNIQITTPIITSEGGIVKTAVKTPSTQQVLSSSKFDILTSKDNILFNIPQMKQASNIAFGTSRFNNLFITEVKTQQKEIQSNIQAPVSAFAFMTRLRESIIQPQIPAQISKQVPATAFSISTNLKTPTKQIPKQETLFKQKPRTKITQRQEPTKPKQSRRTIWFDINEGKKQKVIPQKKVSETFGVWGRRFGKDILLGKARTKKEAGEIFKKFAKGTLGRSGFVESGGRRLTFEELGLGYEFAPAKRDVGRIVQKAKFSLGTGAEVSEIQYFKRKGSKKKSNLFFGGDGKWI